MGVALQAHLVAKQATQFKATKIKMQKLKLKIENSGSGFTLIELIIAITIISAVSTVSLMSFINYNQTQTLNNASLEIASVLNKAKFASLSQVSPSGSGICSGELKGYKVAFNCKGGLNTECFDSSYDYEIFAVCASGKRQISSKYGYNLTGGVTFDPANLPPLYIYFRTITGGVEFKSGKNSIIIRGSGNAGKTITVGSLGKISVQ